MAKLNMPKSAPSIDMTPMVDLAFLLVTFFMLAANFKSDDPVQVSTPSSISDKEVPQKHMIMVTVDPDGRIFFGATGEETKKQIIATMIEKRGLKLNKKQVEEFVKISSFGCDIAQLPAYLDHTSIERQQLKWTIPADSTNNQLREWINVAHQAALNTGKKEYEDESSKTKDKLEVNDYKPIFVLKVDGKAQYAKAKRVIETFRDLNINNLHFVTSLEENPYKKQE
ncbi:MAG: biopolymer transporter ExbD [Flavobacteriia bacterium]|jgi:biopolymer transport protein ExbD|nr:biopolymer transporter ExbD [Flavobacteriia bacterium]